MCVCVCVHVMLNNKGLGGVVLHISSSSMTWFAADFVFEATPSSLLHCISVPQTACGGKMTVHLMLL